MIDRCYIEITNTCNLNCHFCPKHTREKRQLGAEEFNLLTDKIKGKVCFLYFQPYFSLLTTRIKKSCRNIWWIQKNIVPLHPLKKTKL